MNKPSSTLFLICGKIAAGKSTLAKELSSKDTTILISEDEWLAKLYPEEILNIRDYQTYSSRLRAVMRPHIETLLYQGMSVVLDYPANTLKMRVWMRQIFETAGAHHELHFLDVEDEVCLKRLEERNNAGTHEFQASKEEFQLITSYFSAPGEDKGFHVITHKVSE